MEQFHCWLEVSFPEQGNWMLAEVLGVWVENFVKSSGTLTISQTNLALSGNSTLTSDEALSFVTLNLNNFKLTLGSSTSDLTVENAITIDASTEGISTVEADLILMSALTMSEGLLQSSGGTWKLNGDFKKTGGTLSITETDLTLTNNITLTSDQALSFVTLNLNYKTLTLGSSTSDLTVINAITIGQNTEGISTGDADLILNKYLKILEEGSITSTGGIISLQEGGELSGTGTGNGILDVSGSIWTLGDNFTKSIWNSDYVTNNLKIRRQQHIDK